MGHAITLIELSLDFWPRKQLTDPEKLRFRETMVGLLQRHHWCEMRDMGGPEADARQIYDPLTDKKADLKPNFLFPVKDGGGRTRPDWDVADRLVQDRLSRPQLPTGLFLDATFYKGSDAAGVQIRTQHKITDNNNPGAGTIKVLDDSQRRARIEVEVHSWRLQPEFGLVTLDDLAGFDFRGDPEQLSPVLASDSRSKRRRNRDHESRNAQAWHLRGRATSAGARGEVWRGDDSSTDEGGTTGLHGLK